MSTSSTSLDVFGNNELHRAIISYVTWRPSGCERGSERFDKATRIAEITRILRQEPSCVSMQNQFGCVPLHYALDVAKPSKTVIRLLINAFPKGVHVRCCQGNSPYLLG